MVRAPYGARHGAVTLTTLAATEPTPQQVSNPTLFTIMIKNVFFFKTSKIFQTERRKGTE